MKKFLTCILAIILAFSICACGNSQQAEPVAESNLKFGLICLHDENSTYDFNFINAFKEACEAKGVDYLIKTNIGETSDCYDAASELADMGCDIIFADSFGHEDYMIEAAQEFPDVEFCHATGTKAHTEGLPNYHNAFAAIYEGRFLDGIAAGLKIREMIDKGDITEDEARIGYVGAMAYAEVISGYTSFYLGVKRIVPEVTMEVTFTGSWYDETAEKEAAIKLINDGCVLISGHADSMGAPTACESEGIPFVFYNGSVVESCPNTFIVSTKINWAPYFTMVIDAVRNGVPIPYDWVGDMGLGSVEMTEVNAKAAAPGTAEMIAQVIEDLESGLINVFDVNTFTVNGEKVSEYFADVDSDENFEPDTQVVKDGVFMESEYRSAPYFDMYIDGITLLDS